jgi:acid phosphatase
MATVAENFIKRHGRTLAALALAVFALSGCSRDDDGPPPADSLRFAAIGDHGTGGSAQREVARQLGLVHERQGLDLVLLLGDSFYPAGVADVDAPEWQSHFEGVYDSASLPIPFYAVAGNHDHKQRVEAQVAYTFRSARWRMPARHYRFERQIVGMTIGFFGIDTVALEQPFAGYANGLSWLEAALSASTADLRIVFGHAPIWASPGRYGDNAKLEAALAPVLYEHDVAIYLAGHEHHLELQRPRDGLTQVISGAGATNRDVDPGENTRFASSRAGFFVFEIDEDDVRVQAISRDGELLFDERL